MHPKPSPKLAGPPSLLSFALQESKELAEQWEMFWLDGHDYAWNLKNNGAKRTVAFKESYCCCCIPTGIKVVVGKPLQEVAPRASRVAAVAQTASKSFNKTIGFLKGATGGGGSSSGR
jgi:hypothetical protein